MAMRAGLVLAMGIAVCGCMRGPDAGAPAGTEAAAGIPPAAAPAASPRGPGSLPDRGELLAYRDAATSGPDGATWHRVDVSEAHALQTIAGGTLRLRAPDGRMLDFAYDRHDIEEEAGRWTWYGHLAGQPSAQGMLQFADGAVTGTIERAGQRPLGVVSHDGATYLVEAGSVASTVARRMTDHLAPPTGTAGAPAGGPVPAAAALPKTATSDPHEIDVLVGYVLALPSNDPYLDEHRQMRRQIAGVVEDANSAFARSGLATRIRLVRAMPVDYPELNHDNDALEALTGYDAETEQFIAPDPAFAELRAARETYGADLVILVRPYAPEYGDGCGAAWLIGAGQAGIDPAQDAAFGYSVASGVGYTPCGYMFGHMIGHNLGAAHTRQDAAGEDGVLDPGEYGAYEYAFAYRDEGTNVRTLMSQVGMRSPSGPFTHNMFSNTAGLGCLRPVCGTADADNARAVAQSTPLVAAFRAARTPPPLVRNDVDGDGRSDLLWFKWGSLETWYLDGYAVRERAAYTPVGDLFPHATGNFDFGANADIAWRDRAGNLAFWLAGPPYARAPEEFAMPRGWRLQATGDHDGDGNSDLYWRSAVDGRVMYWLLDANRDLVAYRAFALDPAYHLLFTGDLDDNGTTDLLFRRRSDGQTLAWHADGDGFVPFPGMQMPRSWEPIGIGRISEDAQSGSYWQSQMFWRSSVDHRVLVWRWSPYGTPGASAFASDPARTPLGIADTNGDGLPDVLWRRGDGAVTVWLQQPGPTPSFVERYIGNRDTSWNLVTGGR